MNFYVVVYVLALVLGLVSGIYSESVLKAVSPEKISRVSFSSIAEDKYEEVYRQLPCPPPEKAQALLDRIKFKYQAPVQCDNSFAGKLIKVLYWSENIKWTLPEEWKHTVATDFENPVQYIASMNRHIEYEESLDVAIAQNSQKSVSLGSRVFKRSPARALHVLIHESRHSDDRDPGHIPCAYGDIPTAAGGCDARFSLSAKDAGAYSYGVIYNSALGLFGRNLEKSVRDELVTEALVDLANRFNDVPVLLGRLFDTVYTLNGEGHLFLLHPFVDIEEPIKLSGEIIEGKVHRIETDTDNNHLMLFTDQMQVYTSSTQGKVSRFYSDVLEPKSRIKEVRRMRIEFDDFPYQTVVYDDNKMDYIKYNPKIKAYARFKVPLEAHHKIIDIHRILIGFFDEAFYIDSLGKVYVGKTWGSDPEFFNYEPGLNPEGVKWVAATGGMTYDDLYLISERGEFFRAGYHETYEDDEAAAGKSYFVKQIPLTKVGPIKKYTQGLNFDIYLGQNHQLVFQDNEEHNFYHVPLDQEIKDFVILRQADFTSLRVTKREISQSFKTSCNIQQGIIEPWTQRGVGINSDGELVFESQGGNCIKRAVPGFGAISKVNLETRDANGPGEFSETYLVVTNNSGRDVRIYPYRGIEQESFK